MQANIFIHSGSNKGDSIGYEVHLLKNGLVVGTYSAGANPQDSTSPGVSSVSTVKKWARKTAREMFRERFGRPSKPAELIVEVTPFI